MIIPSKHTLLISASQRKEVFLFDPKTACVLYTYSSQSGIASTAAYFELAQQFIIPHLNNTYVNVWDSDAQEPRKFSVGDGQKITSLIIIQGNIAIMGSSKGMIYIYELPSGILIKKSQLYSQSSQIHHIIHLKQMGYLITSTKKQIKLWPIRQLLSQNQKPIAQKTISISLQIIGVQLIRGILCVITQRSLHFYYACNFSLFTLNKDLPNISGITCCSASNKSIYIGFETGRITQIPIDAHEKQLAFQQRKSKINVTIRKGIEIQTKDPITALAYIQSVDYLISGNCKGQVKIWSDQTLKNSVQLFKTSINLLHVIPRPIKQHKIIQSYKIRSFHKQQQTKTDQPIILDQDHLTLNQQQQPKPHSEPLLPINQDKYLQKMLEYLQDASEQYETQIDSLRKQNLQLIQANMRYYTMLEYEQVQGQGQKKIANKQKVYH